MSIKDDQDTRNYKVVVNSEEQYSIWLADKPVPRGWREVGITAQKDACLDYIETVWTDMTPLSLRPTVGGRKSDPVGSQIAAESGRQSDDSEARPAPADK